MRAAGSHSFISGILPRSPRFAEQSSYCSPPCRRVVTLAAALMTFGQLVSLDSCIRHPRRRHPHSASAPSRSSRCCLLRRCGEFVDSIARRYQQCHLYYAKQSSASSMTMERSRAKIGGFLDHYRRRAFCSHIDSIRQFQRICPKMRAFKGAGPRPAVSSFEMKRPAAGSQT